MLLMDDRTIGRLIEELKKVVTNMHKIVNAATNNQRQKKKGKCQIKRGNCLTSDLETMFGRASRAF
jgi:hypothetical protein